MYTTTIYPCPLSHLVFYCSCIAFPAFCWPNNLNKTCWCIQLSAFTSFDIIEYNLLLSCKHGRVNLFTLAIRTQFFVTKTRNNLRWSNNQSITTNSQARGQKTRGHTHLPIRLCFGSILSAISRWQGLHCTTDTRSENSWTNPPLHSHRSPR